MSVSDCSLPSGFLPALRSSQSAEFKCQPVTGLESGLSKPIRQPLHGFWQFIDAAIPVTAVMLGLEVLRLLHLTVASQGVALVAAIVYSSFAAGWAAGLIAAGIAICYELLLLSGPHLFSYTWESATRAGIFAASALTAAVLVGILKMRSEAATYSQARTWASKSLLAEAAQLQNILHQLPLAVLVCDAASDEIVFANEEARSILGADVKRVQSVGHACLFHVTGGRSYSPHEWPWRRCAQLRMAIDDEFLYSRDDGRLLFIRSHARPISGPDGQAVATVISFEEAERRREADRVAC